MPNLKASIKDVRKTKKRTAKNAGLKREIKATAKKLQAAIKEKDEKKVKELLAKAHKAIDKATKAGVFHQNKAARKKSQIAKLVR